jgi:hypothetical protein
VQRPWDQDLFGRQPGLPLHLRENGFGNNPPDGQMPQSTQQAKIQVVSVTMCQQDKIQIL